MPTVLRVGPYRFFFYSADREAKRAKFWLNPLRLHESRGFNRTEIRRLKKLLERNEFRVLEAWHEFFGE